MKIFNSDLRRTKASNKKTYPKLGYYWVPASADGIQVKVKLGVKPAVNPRLGFVKVKREEGLYGVFYTPRRVIVATNAPSDAHPELSWTNIGQDFFKESQFCLYGASDAPSRVLGPTREKLRAISYVIQDSGGFQLSTGVVDFIDPIEVSKAHSLYADSGVALDIPAFGLRNADIVLASARMLVYNNKVMREHTDSAVKLMNVCHGFDLKTRLEYLKIVTKENPLDSLCVGGLRKVATDSVGTAEDDKGSPTGFAAHTLLAMLFTEGTYSHYHVLGAAADWQMALMALMSVVHQKLLTSDSASHSLSGKSGILVQCGNHKKYGHKCGKNLELYENSRCGCPVCSILEYEFPFRAVFAELSSLHNGFALSRKARTYDAIVQNYKKLSSAEMGNLLLQNLLMSHTTNTLLKKDFLRAVDLIYNTKSYKELARLNGKIENLGSLFNLYSNSDKSAQNLNHFDLILKKYEKYHRKSFR